jgi:hypoxanthine phosphoribosyltransferase
LSTVIPSPEDVSEVLLSEDAIQARIRQMGAQIAHDYAGRDPVLVTILKGGLFFVADLCRAINGDLTLDFMAISSYGPLVSTGAVRITKDLDEDIEGRAVLVIEDIIDTGLTLNYLLGVLRQRGPASIEVCVLLDKDVRRIVDLPIAYRGFRIPDRYVVGYGLDHRQMLRNLPFVGVLADEAIA